MKKITMVSLLLSLCFSVVAQNTSLTRYPAISSSLYSSILEWDAVAQGYVYPRHIIVTEGVDTDRTDTSLGYVNYFAVYAPGMTNGGTVLAVDPFPVNDGGVLYSGMTIHDVVNHVDYYIAYSRDIFNNCVTGTFMMAGQQFWIYIHYPATFGIYPTINITWGAGAGPNNPGSITDDFSQVVVDVPIPTNSYVSLEIAKDLVDVPDGTYLFNEAPEGNYIIESSADLMHWTQETNQPLGIIGYSYVYQFPTAGGNKFFRTKKVP
ncbi:MAG TPA: hypothetical protein VL335_02840 [Candidatus Paceibacterota bacterium]|jgi:hypothetical protein|nr:hypothetical protein [Candidatus Paceibacterota bacterium]